MTLDELLLEWSYRSERGYPSTDNPSDVSVLKEILRELKLPEGEIDELVDDLEEKDNYVTTGTDGMEGSAVEKKKEKDKTFQNQKFDDPFASDTDDSYEITSTVSVQDIIDLLPTIEKDQEALLKMKKYIDNRKGEVGFFDRLTTKNINLATIDSANAPEELYKILSQNDDVSNYDVFDQPSLTELGKSGNLFDFYEKNTKLKRQTILKLFDFFGTEEGRGVGKGEMAFALLFNDVKMASGAGDLDWNGGYLEVKGSKARLGGRDRAFSGFNNTLLGQLAIKYDKTDENLVTLIANLSDEEDIDLNDLVSAVVEFENEAHPKGNAKQYFTLDAIKDPANHKKSGNRGELRKAFCKNYIAHYSNTHGVSDFIWWNSEVHGKKSDTPGDPKTKWGTYIIFTPGEADGLVDNDTLLTGMPSLRNLDPTTSRP